MGDAGINTNGQKRYSLIRAGLVILLLLTLAVALCVGRYSLSPAMVLQTLTGKGDDMARTVVFVVRLPRIIMAAIIGAGLAVTGVSLQAMFGNPLVSSFTLGVSYSAGFGAALGILISGNFAVVQVISIIFGFVGMAITYRMASKKGQTGTLMLVLSGTVVGAAFEAMTSFIKYIADPEEKLPAITYWLMGSLAGSSDTDIYTAAPTLLIGILVLWALRWQLNVMSLREDEALSLGIRLKQMRSIVIVATTVITAVTVSVCGIITFVGLAIPHLARMMVGTDHRRLVPATILLGASFLVIIDTLSRSISAAEIPLSILTALVGAPIFGVLLRKTGGAWND